MTSFQKLTAPAFITALAIAVAGCASVPADDPQLSRLDDKLRAAAGDKYTAEYGQADLTKAGGSIAAARTAWRAGHRDEMQHYLIMGEGSINLGAIHGRQERVKAETAALKDRLDQIRLASRDADLKVANDKVELYKSDVVVAAAAVQDAQAAAQSAEDRVAMMKDVRHRQLAVAHRFPRSPRSADRLP